MEAVGANDVVDDEDGDCGVAGVRAGHACEDRGGDGWEDAGGSMTGVGWDGDALDGDDGECIFRCAVSAVLLRDDPGDGGAHVRVVKVSAISRCVLRGFPYDLPRQSQAWGCH